mmetsp:Transcript_7117/g.20317  ORF Transcript_7117/g.20317 Transcript_7117/m.20317 type:complete len:218 (+) Transcript_7117:1037-1690(+)
MQRRAAPVAVAAPPAEAAAEEGAAARRSAAAGCRLVRELEVRLFGRDDLLLALQLDPRLLTGHRLDHAVVALPRALGDLHNLAQMLVLHAAPAPTPAAKRAPPPRDVVSSGARRVGAGAGQQAGKAAAAPPQPPASAGPSPCEVEAAAEAARQAEEASFHGEREARPPRLTTPAPSSPARRLSHSTSLAPAAVRERARGAPTGQGGQGEAVRGSSIR